MSTELRNTPKEFLRLFKEGKDAARAGENERAHDLFRRAIEIDPYHKQVWLWLASVVEDDDDRRVCFENVLELDPDNPTARRQLNKLERRALERALAARTQRRMPQPPPQMPLHTSPTQRKRTHRFRRISLLLLLVLLAVLVLVVVLLYL